MNKNLLFDFSVNKENKTIHVKKAFAAGVAQVWDAWTKAELLDRWWAPKPYHVETKSMDFTEGGSWVYAMVSPENEAQWCRNDYKKIDALKSYTGLDAFCDKEGKVNPDFPRSLWTVGFTNEAEDTTIVDISIAYNELADLERILEMGFKEGFTMGLGNLDELLASS